MFEDGVSRKEIAAKMKLSPDTIYMWTTLSMMPKLAHFLRVFLEIGETPGREGLAHS
jgi:hypothetical protein